MPTVSRHAVYSSLTASNHTGLKNVNSVSVQPVNCLFSPAPEKKIRNYSIICDGKLTTGTIFEVIPSIFSLSNQFGLS